MTFIEYSQAGTGTATITGSVNSTNTLFILPVLPQHLQVFRNGLLQADQGIGIVNWDITWSGSNINFNGTSIPTTGDIITAWVFIG